ncbi:fatty acyl-AMP ligase [Massilia sp. Dwa41.01b]|uniref:fatty acyl-AMP ligase n=1 Tax=Massilia sp. Dwa41.01b TaxID=2709302 RepID=UPI0035A741D9
MRSRRAWPTACSPASLSCCSTRRESISSSPSLPACLLAGAVAVPAAPAHRPRDGARLAALLADAAPALVLCAPELEQATAAALERARCATPLLREEACGGRATPPTFAACVDAVAFLQYTSGSTGQPKGVEIIHANIDANVRAIGSAFGFGPATVMVSWLPLFHDMGLIGSVCAPLMLGFRSILMAPGAFLRRPGAWLEAITRFRATCSGAPNFAWDLCVRRVGEECKRGLDLSSLEVLYNGAEPVRAATLERFQAAFSSCGLRPGAPFPCYGMAEATLLVAGGPRARQPRIRAFEASALELGEVRETGRDGHGARVLVSCGPAAPGVEVAIVDPLRRGRVAPGAIGEIWIAGPGVACGYRGPARDSEDVFGARIADAGPVDPGMRYLRSGDLGFLHEGELFVTGRRKDIVIVHGRKLHAQDIEELVESAFPELAPNSCAAFAVESEGRERLALAVEASRTLARHADLAALGRRIRAAVTDGIGVTLDTLVFAAPGGFPRTTSGKLRRGRCKALLLGGALPLLPPREHRAQAISAARMVEAVPAAPTRRSAGCVSTPRAASICAWPTSVAACRRMCCSTSHDRACSACRHRWGRAGWRWRPSTWCG